MQNNYFKNQDVSVKESLRKGKQERKEIADRNFLAPDSCTCQIQPLTSLHPAIRGLKLWGCGKIPTAATIWSCREVWAGGSGRDCSEPLKRTKLQRNVILADVPLPGSSPIIPWGLGLLSFLIPTPWSSAPLTITIFCPWLHGDWTPSWVLPLTPCRVRRTG